MNVSSTTTVGVDLALQYLVNNYPGTGTANIFRSMLITPPYTFPAVYSDGTVSTYSQERDANMRNPYNLLMNSGYAKEYRTAIQSKVYVDQKLDFITKGLSVRLNASYDYDSEMICWAKGSVIYKNDTIVCMDLQTSKKIIFIRMLHNDIIKAICWNDYKADNYSCPKNDRKKIHFSDLVAENPEFFIRIKKSRLSVDSDSIFISLYSWEEGKKKLVHKGIQREHSKKKKFFWLN